MLIFIELSKRSTGMGPLKYVFTSLILICALSQAFITSLLSTFFQQISKNKKTDCWEKSTPMATPLILGVLEIFHKIELI